MNRLQKIFSNISDEIKVKHQIKRVEAALNVAKINAENDLDLVQQKIEEFNCADKTMPADTIICSISSLLDEKETAEKVLKRIKEIEDFLRKED